MRRRLFTLIALAAAVTGPGLRGLALIGASPRFVLDQDWPHAVDLAVFQQFQQDLQADYEGTLERFLALEMHGDENAVLGLRELKARLFERGRPDPKILEQGLELLEHTDLRELVSRVTVPNLWIAGSRDRLVPAAAMGMLSASTLACCAKRARSRAVKARMPAPTNVR